MGEPDRQYNLSVFHFRCPLCAGEPAEVPLRTYLAQWAGCGKERFGCLVSHLWGAVLAFRSGESPWETRDLRGQLDAFEERLQLLGVLLELHAYDALVERDGSQLIFTAGCAVCGLPEGGRKAGRYFGLWSEACTGDRTTSRT